ncbi:MAG: GAF domain-containing protein [Thermodesulfobacteriota bacterium]
MEKMQTLTPDEFHSLVHAAKAVLAHDSFHGSARVIFDQAKRLTGATAGYIALLSDSGMENEVLFLDDGGLPCSVDPNLPMPIRGLRALAYRQCRTVVENAFPASEHAPFLPPGHVPLRNVMFAPLIVEGKVRGVMGLANKASDFIGHDIELASALGEFAAIALHNSRTLDKLRTTVAELNRAIGEIRKLQGIIPICMHCKKIRDEEGYWHMVEEYIMEHSEAVFSHGLCAECMAKHYPES